MASTSWGNSHKMWSSHPEEAIEEIAKGYNNTRDIYNWKLKDMRILHVGNIFVNVMLDMRVSTSVWNLIHAYAW